MCRLFGFRSQEHASVHDALVTERNALRVQSIEHRDGWGIAHYDPKGEPRVTRGLGSALHSQAFEDVSESLRARTVVAHLRLASVGAVELCNVHPFVQGRWVFAHNGTLRDFDRHRATLEAWIDPELRSAFRSRTDSERAFFLFLTFLGKHTEPSGKDVAQALARTVVEISRLTDEGDQRSGMNFIVTDGNALMATRREKTLFFAAKGAERSADSDPASTSAALRPSHPPLRHTPISQLVVASEQLSLRESWFTVPLDQVVGVDAQMRFQSWSLAELAT